MQQAQIQEGIKTATIQPQRRSSWVNVFRQIQAFSFTLPALVLLVIFLVYPICYVVYLSFQHWDLLGTPLFIGLQNYHTIFFVDPSFLQSVGVTVSAPDAVRLNCDEQYLLARIKVALGGRAAEEIVFGNIATGAESDIQHLTQIARRMVGRWGMSPAIGPIAVIPSDGNGPLFPGAQETSETTQRLVDEEVRRIVESAHADVTELLNEHRSNLDSLVAGLLEHETLDEPDAYQSAGLDRNPLVRSQKAPPVVT